MSGIDEDTSPEKIHRWQAQEKTFNVISHQGNASETHNEISLYTDHKG